MLLPVVGCPNVFTNDEDEDEDDDEASFLPSSSSSFGFFLVKEGALSSGWSENIGRLVCCDIGDSIEGVVVVTVVVDASSSTYEFTGTIGKKKEDFAPPPSPPPPLIRVVALIVSSSWAFWVYSPSRQKARKSRVKSEGEFSFIFFPSHCVRAFCACFAHTHR